MTQRYENPILYSSINQPVDRKTGLVVQQEIPLYQLGRNKEKYDQGFLEIAADRALAKHYGNKRTRCTAIFLPDRVRFTKSKFRSQLFYREIKMFYKSDPKTFCFILYVIDEKTAKRYYEVYQCDNMEDVRRIEDLLEISKHTANRLLLDPVPEYRNIRRRSLPVDPESFKHHTYPEPLMQEAFECPHCQHISRVMPNASVVNGETPSEVHAVTRVKNNNPRSKSTIDMTEKESRDWLRIKDQWRETDYYGYYADSWNRKPRRSHHPMSVRSQGNWENHDYMHEDALRGANRQTVPQPYRNEKQIKPYHTTSTYGRPMPANSDVARMKMLQNGKPYLNRQTMQVMDPYMDPVYSHTQRHHRSLPVRDQDHQDNGLEKVLTDQLMNNHAGNVLAHRPNDKQVIQKEVESRTMNAYSIVVPAPVHTQKAIPIDKSPVISAQKVPSVSLEAAPTSLVNDSKANRYNQADMFFERITVEPTDTGTKTVHAKPAPTINQAKPTTIYPGQKASSQVVIEYDLYSTTVSKPYIYPTTN